MEQALVTSSSASLSLPPSDGPPAVIPVLNLVSITQRDLTQLKLASNYWKALHQRSCARKATLKQTIEQNEARAFERESLLKKEIEHKEAQIRDLRHRLFAKKSESVDKTIKLQPSQDIKRPRGSNMEAVATGARNVRTFPSLKNTTSFKTHTALTVVFSSRHFPVLKNLKLLKSRSRRSAARFFASAI